MLVHRPSPSSIAKSDLSASLLLFLKHINPSSPFSAARPVQETLAQNEAAIEAASAARSILSRFSALRKTPNGKGSTEISFSVSEIIKEGIFLSPATMRRFWRVQILHPEHVLSIFEGFGSENSNNEVEFLFKVFRCTRIQDNFVHLPKTYEIMIYMLIQSRRLREAEFLLLEMRSSQLHDLFSEIISSYAGIWNWKRAFELYDQARSRRGIVLDASCCGAILKMFVQLQQSDAALRVYADMVESRIVTSEENYALDFAIQSLCARENVLESVALLKKVNNLGIIPSFKALDLVSDAYCKKRDFEDFLKFLREWNHVPGYKVCNRIVSSVSRVSGAAGARLFMRSLEDLGFVGDEGTLGILVRWSCREGNLLNAFIYLSEIYSRMLVPNLQTYNSFLGALAKEGMWECLMQTLAEMREKEIEIPVATFRVILAGLCMKRRFSEIELVLHQMEDLGFVDSKEEGVLKAFSLLGLEDLGLKIKRDNGLHDSDVEFFDYLGNGLFLSGDLKILEMRLNKITDDSMNPNFDRMIEDECKGSRVDASLKIAEEAVQMGERVSLSSFCTLFRALVRSKSSKIDDALDLLEEFPHLLKHVDHETLNLSLISLYKKGFTAKMRMVMEVMIQRSLPIKQRSLVAVLSTFYKEDDSDSFQEVWNLVKDSDWLPELKYLGSIFHFLIGEEMLERGFELFEIMSLNNLKLIPSLSSIFIKELCAGGFVNIGFAFFEEISKRVPGLLECSCYEHLLEGFLREKKFVEAFEVMDFLREKVSSNVSLSSTMWETVACILLGFNSREKKNLNIGRKLEVSPSLSKVLLDALTEISNYDLQKLCIVNQSSLLPFESILNMMVRHHCRRKNMRRAYESLSLTIKLNIHLGLSMYRDLLSLSSSMGHIHVGLNLKEHMLKQPEIPSQTIYNIMIFHLSKSGNISMVDHVLDEMRTRCYDLDRFTYNILVHGYHRNGDNEKSIEYLNTMISKHMEPTNRSLRFAISYLCRLQRLDKALKLFLEVETNAWKHGSVIQTVLIKSLLQSSRVKEAESLLRRLQDKDMIPMKPNYDALIETFCKIKRVDTANRLLDLMLKKGNVPSERSYDLVLQGMLSMYDLDKALDVHAEMLGLEMRPDKESNEMLVRALCGHGRTFDAEKVLDVMTSLGQLPSREIFQLVLDRHRKEKNLKEASGFLEKMQRFGILPEFESHWSLISSLRSRSDEMKKEENDEGKGFLSHLLFRSGFGKR